MSNIIQAFLNVVNSSKLELSTTDSGRNRINNMGNTK